MPGFLKRHGSHKAQTVRLLPLSSTPCFLLYTGKGTERPCHHGSRVLQPEGLCYILAQCLLGHDVMCSYLSFRSLVFPPINNCTIHQEHLGDPKAPLVTHPGPSPGFLESSAGGPSPFCSPVSALWLLAKLVRKEPPHRVWYQRRHPESHLSNPRTPRGQAFTDGK